MRFGDLPPTPRLRRARLLIFGGFGGLINERTTRTKRVFDAALLAKLLYFNVSRLENRFSNAPRRRKEARRADSNARTEP